MPFKSNVKPHMAAFDLSTEGAKESRFVIKQFHACLNSLDVIPEQAYRRNSGSYPLVCYINNVVGLFLSKNYEAIPIFVARAVEHMATFPPSAASAAYYVLAKRYLMQVVYHLRNFVDGVDEWGYRIPASFLEAGPQQLP